MAPLVWLITGTSSGIGEQFVHAILARGDKVIAASRNIEKSPFERSDSLKLLQIDVTASQKDINAKAREALLHFGTIDVVVNNSGYYAVGVVEELDYDDLLAQFNVNFFGAIKVTQSLLPHFREKQAGTVVFISSSSAWVGSPYCSPYCSSKFALEGLAESLASETARFGIRVLIVEPGYFRTSLLTEKNDTSIYPPPKNADYAPIATSITDILKGLPAKKDAGDPRKCAERVIDVVKAEGFAKGKTMPRRLVLGMDAVGMIKEKINGVLKDMEEWESVSASTNFDVDESEKAVKSPVRVMAKPALVRRQTKSMVDTNAKVDEGKNEKAVKSPVRARKKPVAEVPSLMTSFDMGEMKRTIGEGPSPAVITDFDENGGAGDVVKPTRARKKTIVEEANIIDYIQALHPSTPA